MAKYNNEIVSKITSLIGNGEYTNFEVCQNVGIAEATFYKWKSEKTEFSEAIKKAEQTRNEFYSIEAKKALLKKIQGYDVTETKDVFTNESGKYVLKERTRTTKHIQPDTTAIIFTLTNREPSSWQRVGGDKNKFDDEEEISITLNI